MRYIILSLSFLFSLVFLTNCGTESTPVYTLTTSVVGEGSITPSGGTFEEGETVTLTSTPNEHWLFSNWSGDGSGSSTTVSIMMDRDKNVVGNFSERLYALNITYVGEGTVTEEVIQSKSEHTFGTIVQLTPNPSDGWKFVEWSGDVNSNDEVVSVTVDGEMNVTVTFEKIDYPLTISIEGDGTVDQEIVQSKTTEYPYETVIQLTSKPTDGWVFYEWNGDLDGSDNPQNIEIDEQKEVTSKFKSIDELLTIEISGEGTVDIQQESFEDNPSRRTVTLSTNPLDGWIFSEWGGDVESTDDVIKVIINDIINLTVKFEPLFFLHSNGVTIMCPNTSAGDKGIINGVEYESVDRDLLIQRRNEGADLSKVCTSKVQEMVELFRNNSTFNQDIKNWDVSNVTSMMRMFDSASSFNQDISLWDVRNVTNMFYLFNKAESFNQDIGNWNTSNVISMRGTFRSASSFNQDIGDWDTSNVRELIGTFSGATSFNQNIGDWDTKNVSDMSALFADATNFNQNIGGWDVSGVRNMSSMFLRASNFNQSLNKWCVKNIVSEPTNFSTGSPLTSQNKPQWGTCPD